MMVDMARSQRAIHGADVDIISPVCSYVVRRTLRYLGESGGEGGSVEDVDVDMLKESLEKLGRRWDRGVGLPFA